MQGHIQERLGRWVLLTSLLPRPPLNDECCQVRDLAGSLPDDKGAEDKGLAPAQGGRDEHIKVEQQGRSLYSFNWEDSCELGLTFFSG